MRAVAGGDTGGAEKHPLPLARRVLRSGVPGILGVVDDGLSPAIAAALTRAMAGRLRPSDRLRIEIDPAPEAPAALGRVDRGVFDPDPAPAVSDDGACRAVLAGEVRGFAGARALLAAYEARGETALTGLSGSFAFAVWDGRSRRLVIANDHFGLRNVYYVATEDRFVFAPQVWALLADARLPRRLDPQAVAEFLAFQCVLGDRTLLEDVKLLPPASLLVFEPGRGVRIAATWTLRYHAQAASPQAHARVLAHALRQAAHRQVEAGSWRVGLPLSGGLDSRTLLAAVQDAGRPIATVTYGQPTSDDARLAARLARLTGLEHHVLSLTPGYLVAEARAMVERTDGMHSCLNAHAAVLRGASTVCDVILLGNGGDCLLDGLWAGPPAPTGDQLAAWLAAKTNLGLSLPLAAEVIAPGAPFADVGARAQAGVAAALASVAGDDPHDRADAFNVVHRHRRWVLQGVPAQATHVDFRHPYYDDDVVSAALAVPAALRAHRRAHVETLKLLSPTLARVRQQGKPFGYAAPPWRWTLYRGATRVRDAVRWRANRLGLNPTLARHDGRAFADYNDELRHGSRALVDRVLLDERALDRGFWRPDGVRALVDGHLSGRANHAPALGVLLTLELFLRLLETPAALGLSTGEPPPDAVPRRGLGRRIA